MKALWRKFRDLPHFQQAIAMRAGVLLPFAVIILRVVGLRQSLRVFGWLSRPESFSNGALMEDVRPPAETITRIVQAVARRHPFRSNCLSRSLVLWSLLSRSKIDSDLRIGVGRKTKVFAAHAWVEHRGRILGNDKELCRQFVVFDRSIAAGACK